MDHLVLFIFMKALYILALVIATVFGITIFYFLGSVYALRRHMYTNWDASAFDRYYAEVVELTLQGAIVSIIFLVFFVVLFSFSIRLIKRTTAKVISIIGLSLTGLVLLLTILPTIDPRKISFDEFGPVLFLFDLVLIAFCIVNLVQAMKTVAPKKMNEQTIDDIC